MRDFFYNGSFKMNSAGNYLINTVYNKMEPSMHNTTDRLFNMVKNEFETNGTINFGIKVIKKHF